MSNISNVLVPSSGPDGAAILIIGEAPGSDETRLRQPFVGKSGELLRNVLIQNGIHCATSDECERLGRKCNEAYGVKFFNLCNYQPDKNNFQLLEGTQELKDGIRELNEYISKWRSNIKVCITLGAMPLQYVCDKYGIEKWRGSVIEVDGLTILPTYHPAHILRKRKNYPIFAFDIGKACKIVSKGYELPKFNFTIDPEGLSFEEALQEVREAGRVSVDIETIKHTKRILCCGFGLSRSRAICIVNRTSDETLDTQFRRFCELVLTDESITKIFHNGIFDIEIFNSHYIETRNFTFDTMVAQHVIAPELPKGLDFITSVYTDIPYYKDKGRMALPENEKGWGKLKDEDRLTIYEYNCLDCVATFWCYEEMLKEIEENKNFKHIFQYEMEEHDVAFHLIRAGMPWDLERKDQIKNAVEAKFIEDQRMLDAIVGESINVGSPKQKKELLYKTWNLPERVNEKHEVSADEDAIVSLIGYCKEQLGNKVTDKAKYEWQKKLVGLMTVLKLMGYRKLLGSYVNIDYHPDNRVRSTYKITGTETGRWSCSTYWDNTGLNAQTMPRQSFEIN